jgi:hypothetical protein
LQAYLLQFLFALLHTLSEIASVEGRNNSQAMQPIKPLIPHSSLRLHSLHFSDFPAIFFAPSDEVAVGLFGQFVS